MMEDLAMQLFEILNNSIHAGASRIYLVIRDSIRDNEIVMTVEDNGRGMDAETLKRFSDPFYTTRTTRKIGMGVPFMKGLTEMCNGRFQAESTPGKGTRITASVQRDHIDTPEMGSLGELMMDCIQADEQIYYELTYQTDTQVFRFNTDQIKEQLQDVPISTPEVLLWIKGYIDENVQSVKEAIA